MENNKKTLFFADIDKHNMAFELNTEADRLFRTKISHYYFNKINPHNKQDPLALQVLPSQYELINHPDFIANPVGDEEAMKTPGLIHKYAHRVLLIASPSCAIHCRYCFRREFNYKNTISEKNNLDQAIKYIEKTPSINEIILSGGDPLTLPDKKIFQLCNTLTNLPQITTLRIHSRYPCVDPERISPTFYHFFYHLEVNKVWVSHINHPDELDDQTSASFKQLHDAGFYLLNQSVLLKDVNNNVDTLVKLSNQLFQQGVLPYYLHLLDKVKGSTHFDVDLEEALQLYQNLQTELPGYLLPKMVREIAMEKSKTLIGKNC